MIRCLWFEKVVACKIEPHGGKTKESDLFPGSRGDFPGTWAHSLTFPSAHAARALDIGKQLEDSVREGQPPKHVLRQQDALQQSEFGEIQKV